MIKNDCNHFHHTRGHEEAQDKGGNGSLHLQLGGFLRFQKEKKGGMGGRKKNEKIEDADWLTFLGANFLFWKVIVIQEKKYFPFLEGDCNHS